MARGTPRSVCVHRRRATWRPSERPPANASAGTGGHNPPSQRFQITLDTVQEASKLNFSWGMRKGRNLMSTFQQYHNSLSPETLALLETALNETWSALQSSGSTFNEKTRAAIADLIVKFAAQGEHDHQRLKALVLAALPSYEAQ